MTFTLTTSGAILAKAGDSLKSEYASSGALIYIWGSEAEGTFCGLTRKDWITGSAAIQASLLPMISDAVSSLAAIKAITYDITSYTTKEAQTMMDYLTNNANMIITKLMEDENQKFK